MDTRDSDSHLYSRQGRKNRSTSSAALSAQPFGDEPTDFRSTMATPAFHGSPCCGPCKHWIIPRTFAQRISLVAITFRFHYPIERTMAFEREYHPNLRLTLPEKRELLQSAITLWMLEDGKLVGETYGVPWGAKEEMPGFARDPEAVYCYSNTILGKYQGKGYGAILKAAFIGRVSRDFKRIYGHARPGRSQALNKKFGAKMGKTYKNWFGTGEDYKVYVLHLGK
jgi:GNAT superfamily N-acetyltransferase